MPAPFLAFLGPEEADEAGRDGPALPGSAPRIVSRRALYLVVPTRAPAPAELAALARLLDGAEPAPEQGAGDGVLYVVPRRGTVSPWSSKATDLAQRIGLAFVRRIEVGVRYAFAGASPGEALLWAGRALRDRMTEEVVPAFAELGRLFEVPPAGPLVFFAPAGDPARAVAEGARRLGLALEPAELVWLAELYGRCGRAPSDAELMTFAQINSEHCRHKHFRAPWRLADGRVRTLFSFITATHEAHPGRVLVAYRDNAAVIAGRRTRLPYAPAPARPYRTNALLRHAVAKVETHNHPTAIEPFAGAATGGGGEIRDESATGRGARPGMGLVGFVTAPLRLGDDPRGAGRGLRSEPWEAAALPPPARIASALDIMLKGPLGSSSYGNEFGRPTLAGFFRTFEAPDPADPGLVRGFHKPVMLAGGLGQVTDASARKGRVRPGQPVVVLGGPAYRIGIGGGSLSSQGGGSADEDLDYASVQRGNPEMERRAQEVIDALSGGDGPNPIVAIHDVGAGGLANAVTELVADADAGAEIDLGAVPSDDPTLSPMELWCNESQERYVLALESDALPRLEAVARRERCPWAVIGRVSAEPRVLVRAPASPPAVDLPTAAFFPPPAAEPRPLPDAPPPAPRTGVPLPGTEAVPDLLRRVLRHPAVADKSFLVTINDRTVGGRSARDPLVGPRQVAVADVAVQCDDLRGRTGWAMALGERPPVALLDPGAASRLAAAEALLNLAAADVPDLSEVALSANWMAARGRPGDEGALFRAVSALGDFALALGIPVPVGKDSLSMAMAWEERGERREVRAPVTLVVTAFGPVRDAGRTLVPLWPEEEGALVLLAPGDEARLGGSILEEVLADGRGRRPVLGPPPDIADPLRIARLFALVRRLARRGIARAYHDRSDGGLLVTLLEMAFASGRGFTLDLPEGAPPLPFLFAEESGAVIETAPETVEGVVRAARRAGLEALPLGRTRADAAVVIGGAGVPPWREDLAALRREWSALSDAMRRIRDRESAVASEHGRFLGVPLLASTRVPEGLWADPAPARGRGGRIPRVGILREEGTNGHLELAEAFARAGFRAIDLPSDELHRRPRLLERLDVLAAAGGFSYGDVLGAGRGWALALARDSRLRAALRRFLADPSRLALGVCNGCQMFAALAALAEDGEETLVPGGRGWPRFVTNLSRRFEGRWVNLRVEARGSPWLRGMDGAVLPVPVAHGEGRALFPEGRADDPRVVLRYADERGAPTGLYPANPNGSPGGAAGLVNDDGRILILMPHPERAFRTLQHSWHPPGWGEDAPWLRLFRNARAHVFGR